MPTCLLCKKDVISGYVVCGDCTGELKTKTMPPVLGGFAVWLGAELVRQDTVYFCSVCKARKCDDKTVCRKGIAAWFRDRAEEYWEASNRGILGRLKTVCPFPKVFEDLEPAESPHGEVPRRKIGHIRADYDGYRWWNTFWRCHYDLATPKMANEIDRIYEELTAKDALHDLNTLCRFCWSHPEAQVSQKADDEFNFYLAGETCDFWVRLITREKDYNMYLHAYAKAEEGREEH